MIFDKTKLLSVFDITKGVEPMKYTTPPNSAAPAPTVERETKPTDGPFDQ